MDRRAFLAVSAAGMAQAQLPPAVLPVPAKAKITSAVMLWTLPGTFEQRVKIAAEAGLQTVGLRNEYTQWDAAQLPRAKRYMESFGMTAETLCTNSNGSTKADSMLDPARREAFLANLRQAIQVAKKLETPNVVVVSGEEIAGRTRAEQYENLVESAKQAGALAAAADVILLVEPLSNKQETKSFLCTWGEGVQLVKDVDNPHVRLLCSVYEEHMQVGTLAGLQGALDYTSCLTLADAPGRSEPGTGSIPLKEVYRTLQKSGYSHTVAMEYAPKGTTVASLKRAVDQFRAAVNESGATPASPLNPTEGPFV